MMKYWDGQPVRFVCCERGRGNAPGEGPPWGRVFWCVVIRPVEESDPGAGEGDEGEDEEGEVD